MIDFRKQPEGYEQGIYEMPFDQYRAIPALNSSSLKYMKYTPNHFRSYIEDPRPPVSSQRQKAFDIGKVFDAYILDGGWDAVNKIVIADPGISKRNKSKADPKLTEYDEWYEKIGKGRIVLKQEEINDCVSMAESAFKKLRFTECFNGGHKHRVIIWFDPNCGLWCKAEIDQIMDDTTVVDLKSTRNANPYSFRRDAERLGYINQAAFYLRGLTIVTLYHHNKYLLAAVEKDRPFESVVFRPSQSQLEIAADENMERMISIADCLRSGNWPGYLDEIVDLESGQFEDNQYFYEEELEEINGF